MGKGSQSIASSNISDWLKEIRLKRIYSCRTIKAVYSCTRIIYSLLVKEINI